MPGLPMLKALWLYRNFVWSSVLREFHGKYRESLLGAFWSVANPLTMIVIYTVIFGRLMRPTLAGHENTPFAFSIFLCAGVITWGLFAEMLGRLNNVFLEHGNLIKKANFPRICLPAIVTVSALLNWQHALDRELGAALARDDLAGHGDDAFGPQLVRRLLKPVCRLAESAHGGQQLLPGGREMHAALTADKQIQPQFVLKRVHHMRQPRLRVAKFFRRGGEAAAVNCC